MSWHDWTNVDWLHRWRSCCVVSLSKTLYPFLSAGSTQEDPFRHDWKIVVWDVKNPNKQTNVDWDVKNQECWIMCLLVSASGWRCVGHQEGQGANRSTHGWNHGDAAQDRHGHHVSIDDYWERRGSVVECLTPDWGAAGLSLTGITVLCPWARTLILA